MLNKIKYKKTLLLFLLLYFTVVYSLMWYFDISCVFLEFFNIPCPGCGMTRATLSLLRLDFLNAVKYNAVVFFMPYIFIYVFFDLKHKIHGVLLCLIAALAVVNWIIKIYIYSGGC
ncbi:MAG: DUF2752 domain-containing protein [Clostridia bacterium]|nr:DUF2752 domain-containing protein [Clostridia bacterium]